MLKEALLYEQKEDNKVACFLCNHHCLIPQGKLGICLVRENTNGKLYTHSFGRLVACHIDPIEKKPLFQFMPGTMSFSIATAGCNFRCGFCQNWQISQIKEVEKLRIQEQEVSPEEVVQQAINNSCKSISYTYTEPTIFFEYALEISRLAHRQGLKNIFVTNGYMTAQALGMIKTYLDAANVDLKSFRDDYYRKVCSARLEPVLENIKLMKELGIWVEITTLVVPGLNDSEDELTQIARFIAGVGKEIPWHISRFHPDYKMTDSSATPLATLKMARELGKRAGLRYVYLGNVPGESEDTYCYNCAEPLIRRVGFEVLENKIEDSRCPFCKTNIDGILRLD